MYIDSTTAWKVVTRTLPPRRQAAVINMLGIPGGPDPIVNSTYATGESFISTLSSLGENYLQYDTGNWATVPNATSCSQVVLRVHPVGCNTVKQPVPGCVACPMPQQITIPVYRYLNNIYANLGATAFTEQASNVMGCGLAVMASMQHDSLGAHTIPPMGIITADRSNSYNGQILIYSYISIFLEALANFPCISYGSVKHIERCMSGDENHGPEHVLYDEYEGTIDSVKALGQSITDLYKKVGVTDRDYHIHNEYIPNETINGATENVEPAMSKISDDVYTFLGYPAAQELLSSLYNGIKSVKEETNSLSTTTDGGVYGHEPQGTLNLAGDPWSNMMVYLLPTTSYGYNNAIGYQLTNRVNAIVKCLTQGIVLDLSIGRWMLVTGTFSPLFPYIPTSFPTIEYTATVDGRPSYVIDRGGGIIRTEQPPDVYPYKPKEEIQPSEQLIVQDEYADVLKALANS
jgi:hypothetical protein